MLIGDRTIGQGNMPFIIAELSGNHDQSLDKALAMVDAAAAAGACAIKLQTYTPDTLTLDVHEGEFVINNEDSLWHGESFYNLYQKAMTPWEWHQPLFERASQLGLIAFSSPFDVTAVDFLEDLQVPCYKIASFENIDHQLLKAVAQTGKPVIMSTGMATQSELAESVAVLQAHDCTQLALLKCTSHYPAQPKDANIATIPHLKQLFDCEVGLSDHTQGVGVAVAAVALGASIVEKHFVLDRSEGGVDAEFSLEPAEFKQLVDECRRAQVAIGKVHYGCTEQEVASRSHRRSLYIAKDTRAGEVLTLNNVRSVRPGYGLAPKELETVLGRVLTQDAKKGTPLTWKLVGQLSE